jgi:hypothetical protein
MRTILLHIFDDEELLTGPDQAQFPAGNFLDGLRILAQLARLLAELRVFSARPDKGGLERPVLLPRLDHGQQPAISHERVDDEHAADGDDQIPDNPAAPLAGRGGGCRAGVAGPLLHEVVAE